MTATSVTYSIRQESVPTRVQDPEKSIRRKTTETSDSKAI